MTFKRIYNFLLEENLLNPNQSGFRLSDSSVNQLFSVTHEIFKAFDCNPLLEVRSVFSDTSKAFDKVWHEGLLYKLMSMGLLGELQKLLENYFLLLERSRIYIKGARTKLSIFRKLSIKKNKKENREQKELERSRTKSYALRHRKPFLKKIAIVNNFAGSKDLSEKSLNLVILFISKQGKLIYLDKDTDHFYLSSNVEKINTNLVKELKYRLYFF